MRQRHNVPDFPVPSTSSWDRFSPHNSSASGQYGLDETWDFVDDGYTPFPSHLPTNNMSDSYGRQAAGALHLSETKDLWSKIGQVGKVPKGVQLRQVLSRAPRMSEDGSSYHCLCRGAKLHCLGSIVIQSDSRRCMSYSLVSARRRQKASTLFGLCPGQTASLRIPLLHLRILKTHSGELRKPFNGRIVRIAVQDGVFLCILWLLCAAWQCLSTAASTSWIRLHLASLSCTGIPLRWRPLASVTLRTACPSM